MMSDNDLGLILKHLEDDNDRWNVLTMRNDLQKAVQEIIRLRSIVDNSSFESNVIDLIPEASESLENCGREREIF